MKRFTGKEIEFFYNNKWYYNMTELLHNLSSRDLFAFHDALCDVLDDKEAKLKKCKREKLIYGGIFVLGNVLCAISPMFSGVLKDSTFLLGLSGHFFGLGKMVYKFTKQVETNVYVKQLNNLYDKVLDEMDFRRTGKEIFPEYFEDFPDMTEAIKELQGYEKE